MERRRKQAVPEKSSSCPLPLPPEARREVVDAWLAGIPAEIRGGIGGLRVVEVAAGFTPAGRWGHECPPPGLALEDALYRLAGRAGMFRSCCVVLSDGQVLFFEPDRFLSHKPASA